jgi:hypothetical protein
MRLLAQLAAAVGLILALAVPALAQAVTPAQHDALAARIETFDVAMRASDMAGIMGVVPPKVLDEIAKQNNITAEQLIAAAQEQINTAMADIKLVSFGMDLDKAEYKTLPDGTTYALIPTETVMDLGAQGGGKFRATASTLGLLDGDTWYLVRVEDPQQVAILKTVYPAFADVVFPTGSMGPVTE